VERLTAFVEELSGRGIAFVTLAEAARAFRERGA
jgi:hypothetical protein